MINVKMYELVCVTDEMIIKLSNINSFNINTLRQIIAFRKEFVSCIKLAKELRGKLVIKWCDKNEEGKPIIKDKKPSFTKNNIEFNKEIKEYLQSDVVLNCDIIIIKNNEFPIGIFNVNDLIVLDPFISIV